jgi:hypothetical protein
MDIYIVSHYYSNGESYEDYREYEYHEFYSTFEKASEVFWDHVTSDYEGKYELIRKTLDTQEAELLETSAELPCTPCYSRDDWQGDYDYDEDNCYDYDDVNPYNSIKEYWEWEDNLSYCCDDISEEDDKAWFDYFTKPGTNYQMFKEIDDEIKERKKQIEIDELNSLLKELLTDKKA